MFPCYSFPEYVVMETSSHLLKDCNTESSAAQVSSVSNVQGTLRSFLIVPAKQSIPPLPPPKPVPQELLENNVVSCKRKQKIILDSFSLKKSRKDSFEDRMFYKQLSNKICA